MKILRIALPVVISICILACNSQRKAPAPYYLDQANDTTLKSPVTVPELKIQKDDKLAISVYSLSTDPKADAPFNLPVESGAAAEGFLVDASGNIEFPRLGTIHAEGLTKNELAAEIRKRLTEPVELLRKPSVIIRFLNYKITVMGQVAREGVLTIPGERLTILEAIGLAGGVTDYGKKDVVKILRETNGERQIGFVNLASDSLFLSPYYNLVQNDVVIVAPTKLKARMADQQVVAQRISIGIGVITAAAFIYNIFK